MKLTKSIIIASATALLAGAGLSSCSDYLDLKPIDYYPAVDFWVDQSRFEGNIVAVTNQFRDYEGTIINTAGEKRAGGYFGRSTTAGLSSATGTGFVNSNIDASSAGFSNFASWYGLIANCNEFIYYAEQDGAEFTGNARQGLLGIIYGMRAYAYFQLHKMYGTCPLRLTPQVVLGDYNPVTLYAPRAKASEIIAQIRSDLNASLTNFNQGSDYVLPQAQGNLCYYWNKAATEMLYGEFLMWIGKVSTDDWTADPQEVSNAKQYFTNVVNNYGYGLVDTYENVFAVTNKKNKEVIFAFNHALDVSTIGNWSRQYQYPNNYGVPGRYLEKDGNWLGYNWSDVTMSATPNAFLAQNNFEPCYTQYKSAYYYQFNEADSRSEVWIPAWNANEGEADENYPLKKVENFDPSTHYLAGAFFFKYKGQLNANGMNASTNDVIIYRLPLAYMYLAEIANFEGDYGTVASYINLIRERAYGDNWDEATYGYTAGSFLDNEVAILQEKDKEFICEGQRWWDIRRLTAVKGGTDSDHLIFRPESCIGWGLTVTGTMCEVNTQLSDAKAGGQYAVVTNEPVLDYSTQKHLVLYPLDATLLGSDPELTQTPGYN